MRGAVVVAPYLEPGGLSVTLISREGGRSEAATDADGGFVFSPVIPGEYVVSARPAGFALSEQSVRVVAGATVEVLLEPVWRGAAVAVTGKVAVEGGGDPTGAEVEFLLLPQRRRMALRAVGVSGDFTERVVPGEYELVARHPLYVTQVVTALRFVEGTDVNLDPLVLAINPASLTGHVTKEVDGASPVDAAGVVVTLDPVGVTTTTDGNGNFSLTGLSSGARRVRFSLDDFHDDAFHEVMLSPGLASALAPAQLKLDRGSIVGEVTLADRQPATGISVGVLAARKATTVVPSATEPWRGTFTLTDVPVGSWEVSVARQGYSRATRGGVPVVKDRSADVGTLTLTKLQGDFIIDDGDADNTMGYTRTTQVTLLLTGFSSAAAFRASEDASFTGASWAPFTGAQQPFTLSSAQGTHTVYAQYRDGNMTESPVFVSTIVLDSLAPSMPELSINDGAEYSRRAQPLSIRLSAVDTAPGAVDQVSGIREVRLAEAGAVDGQGRLIANPRSYARDDVFSRSSSADGPVTLYAQVFDHAGNQTAVISDMVVIDTQPPVGSLSIRRGARATEPAFTDVERVTLELSAPDGGVPAEANGGPLFIKLAASQPQLASAPSLSLAGVMLHELDPGGPDGLRQVWFVLRDAAGNETAPASQTITLDRTAPVVTLFSLGVGAPTRAATFPLSWTVTDAFGLSTTQGFTASEDAFFQSSSTAGPMMVPATNGFTLTPSAGDGSRVVYARFRDRAGNDAFASARTEVDRTPPTGSFQLEGRLADSTPSQQYTATANITAILFTQGATEVAVGDEALTACPSTGYVPVPNNGRLPVTLSPTLGPRTVKLCLRDLAGNVSDVLSANITYETAAPTGCVLSTVGYRADTGTAPPNRTARPVIAISLTGCSSQPAEWVVVEGSVTCSMPGLGWERYAAGSFALRGADGVRQLSACIRTESRNVATIAPVNMDLDSTPPLGPSLVLDNGAAWVNLAAYTARGSAFSATASGSVTGATDWSLSESTTFTTWQTLGSTNPQSWTFPGTGARRLYAIFRDDLGNTTQPVTDDITFDIVPPSVAGLSLSLVTTSPDPAFVATSNFALSVGSAPPADAASALVAQVATSTLCTAAGVFSGSLPRPVEKSFGVVGVGGDGAKRVCVAWLDAAGNSSAPLTANLTVDTTPPGPPEISTPPALVSLANLSPYGVDLLRPVIETNFLRAEIRGGSLSSWTTTTATASTTHFDFSLVSNAAQEQVSNALQVRVVDRAGNVGPFSEVLIVTDIKSPANPTLGVSNLNGGGTLYWAAPTDTDLARYYVDYGPAPGQYNGSVATEGVSPIEVPPTDTQLNLSGLVNGNQVFARLRAQDRAGNVSAPSQEVTLQPNVMSLTQIAETDLSMDPVREITELEVEGDVLYGVGTDLNCFDFSGGPTSPTQTVLFAIDLSQLKSPTQAGRLDPSTSPALLWTLRFAEPQSSTDCSNVASDLLLDGPWGFLAVNSNVRILKMGRRGAAPSIVTTLTFPWKVRSMHLQGTVLFANGEGGVMAVDVSALYDDTATTVPSATSPVGVLSDGGAYWEPPGYGQFASVGVTVSRNRFIQFARTEPTGGARFWNVADALDGNAATAWNDADYGGELDYGAFYYLYRAPIISGNLSYGFYDGKLQSRDLSSLWTGTPTTLPTVLRYTLGTSFSMGGPLTVLGSGAWASEENGDAIYSFDLRGASGGQAALGGKYQVDPFKRVRSLKAWGPYLFTGSSRGQVLFYEVATPRSMRPVQQVSYGGASATLVGPLLLAANGSALDLHGTSPTNTPVELASPAQVYNSNNANDAQDIVSFGDYAVAALAGSSKLRVYDLRKTIDRNQGTTASLVPFSDGYDVTLTGVLRTLQVEAWGNALIVLEYRADGFWLEAFDARSLRDGNDVTVLTAAASRGAQRVSTVTGTSVDGQLSLSHGRAIVVVRNAGANSTSSVTNGLQVWDFRNLFDDDATTGGFVAQGTLPLTNARSATLSGTRAYVSTSGGLDVWDVSPAMDDSAATLLSATLPLATLTLSKPVEVVAYGTRVFAANWGTGFESRTWALDFSDLSAPRVSSLAFVSGGSVATAGPNGQVALRNTLVVAGEHVFVGGGVGTFANTTVLALE